MVKFATQIARLTAGAEAFIVGLLLVLRSWLWEALMPAGRAVERSGEGERGDLGAGGWSVGDHGHNQEE